MIVITNKLSWRGTLLSVQPRIRLTRSFDQRSHTYLGYALRLQGTVSHNEREFLVGIGKVAQAKHGFQVGGVVSGRSEPVADARLEPVEYYKTAGLTIIQRVTDEPPAPPPWQGVAPELPVYRARGHRRLDPRTYKSKCTSCIWGCRMPVEIIVDHWKPRKKQYRFETFCYGPKSCSFYRAGPTRKVPGRRGMTWEEEDWVDEEATSHRAMDE